MTWSLTMRGHGTPNDVANAEAREEARQLAERLKRQGQSVTEATFHDNEGTHHLLGADTDAPEKAGA